MLFEYSGILVILGLFNEKKAFLKILFKVKKFIDHVKTLKKIANVSESGLKKVKKVKKKVCS